jgi:flagellar biosynthesis protein FlhG
MDNKQKSLSISILSGKGGVGKTNIALNLAYALHALNSPTLLIDCDLGLANLDVLLGITPEKNLEYLLRPDTKIEEVLISIEQDLDFLPAASGVTEILSLSTGQKLELLEAMDYLENKIDFLIVDTGAGLGDNVIYFNLAVQERLLVLTPEPTSLTDAYALVKVLKNKHNIHRFRVIVNMARTELEAKNVFKKLYAACDHFLSSISLDLVGIIPHDTAVKKSVTRQVPFCHSEPHSSASRAMQEIARKINNWQALNQLDGNIKFFWKKLLFQE